MDLGLENKVVIISGATGAIGTEICRAFLEEGAIILPLYRKEAKYMVTLEYLRSFNLDMEKVHPFQIDFNDGKFVFELVKDIVSQFGKIDVLVNNVGKSTERPFLMMEESEFERDIDVNLNIPARMIRHVLKHMFIAKRGNIINISSLVASKLGRGVTAYAAAKAGVDRLTQTIAMEVGAKGIRINSVCPGIIKTDMSKPIIDRAGEYILSETPLQRYGIPGDVSQAVLFLASEKAASFITGHTLIVDGGIGL